MIVLLNGSGDRMEIATYALAALRAALAGAPAPPPAPPADPTAVGVAAADYAGEYVLAAGGAGWGRGAASAASLPMPSARTASAVRGDSLTRR